MDYSGRIPCKISVNFNTHKITKNRKNININSGIILLITLAVDIILLINKYLLEKIKFADVIFLLIPGIIVLLLNLLSCITAIVFFKSVLKQDKMFPRNTVYSGVIEEEYFTRKFDGIEIKYYWTSVQKSIIRDDVIAFKIKDMITVVFVETLFENKDTWNQFLEFVKKTIPVIVVH